MEESSRTPARPAQPRNWVAAGAVSAVALVAVLTTWLTLRPQEGEGRPAHPLEEAVVKAPPVARPDTSVAGGPPAPTSCPECGVVESVALANGHQAYELHVRMSDGSIRRLQQAEPVAAGAPVRVQDGVARPVRDATPQRLAAQASRNSLP